MGFGPLLLALEAMQIERIRFTPEAVILDLVSTAPACCCPECGQRSARIHSRYRRRLHDLPAHGRIILLSLHLRRFFCDHPDCPKQTFAERLPEVMQPHARRTRRLTAAMQSIAFASGGEGGARLAGDLGMITSPDTLLRLMRRAPLPDEQTKSPQVLGVDDWAIRRGQRYGTILCDLQLHRPIELLPERSCQGLAKWLIDHPGTQIITRDRGGDYARGAAIGAPNAVQVADRWHLLHNLTEALEQALDRQHVLVTEAARASAQSAPLPSPTPIAAEPPPPPTQSGRRQRRQVERRARRMARYEEVKTLQAQGFSLRQIATRLKLSRCTVRRFARSQQFPERASRVKRATELDRFIDFLKLRWEQGCHCSARLYRELKKQGYTGSRYTVRRRVAAWRQPTDADHVTGRRPASRRHRIWRPSSRTVAWLLIEPDRADSAEQQAFLAALHRLWPELSETMALIHEFRLLVRGREHDSLEAWVQLAQGKSIAPEVANFARTLRKDWKAVAEAVKGVWSNGQVEGQVNRLKLIKRQMYGRANFDLLRQRVLRTN